MAGWPPCFADCKIKVLLIWPLCLESVKLDLSSKCLIAFYMFYPSWAFRRRVMFEHYSTAVPFKLYKIYVTEWSFMAGSKALAAQQKRICMFCLQTFGYQDSWFRQTFERITVWPPSPFSYRPWSIVLKVGGQGVLLYPEWESRARETWLKLVTVVFFLFPLCSFPSAWMVMLYLLQFLLP